MKAVILAAGIGQRLGELTRSVPKPMLKVGGKPVLEHILELAKVAGVTDALIHLHYLPEVVMNYFGDGSRHGISIRYHVDPQLHGTAGAIRTMASKLPREPYFVLYGDVYSNLPLQEILERHKAHSPQAIATVGLIEFQEVSQYGIVRLESDGRITQFLEKPRPEQVFSHLINTGYYVLSPEIIDWIADAVPVDFARGVFPTLSAHRRLFGVKLQGWLRPIDTPEALAKARAESTE